MRGQVGNAFDEHFGDGRCQGVRAFAGDGPSKKQHVTTHKIHVALREPERLIYPWPL